MKLVPVEHKGVVSDMGLTHVAVTITSLTSPETYTADFLVDTGAVHSMAPSSELKRIGIEPVGTDEYEVATGEVVQYQYGLARMWVLGHLTATEIVFGPENTGPILGVVALESAGFIVDPKNQRIRKLRALPLKRMALKAVA